jgi:hypothetical protein
MSLLTRKAGETVSSRHFACAFVSPWIASGLYVFIARLWLVPDRRIGRVLTKRED